MTLQSKSKNIQKVHIRKYKSGKKKVINKDNTKNTSKTQNKQRKKQTTQPFNKPKNPSEHAKNNQILAALYLPVLFPERSGFTQKRKNEITEDIQIKRLAQLRTNPNQFIKKATLEETSIYIMIKLENEKPTPELRKIYQYLYTKLLPMMLQIPKLKLKTELTNKEKNKLEQIRTELRTIQWQKYRGE